MNASGLIHENCAVCHGNNGRAHTLHGWLVGAQNLTNSQWQSGTKDAEIIRAIKTGPGAMPAFSKRLSMVEINVLAAYVRTFRHER